MQKDNYWLLHIEAVSVLCSCDMAFVGGGIGEGEMACKKK